MFESRYKYIGMSYIGDASDIEGYDRKRSGLSNVPPHMKQDNDGIE